MDHVRAHYQSLEYMLSSEDRIVSTVLGSWDAGAAPKPANIEEAIRLAVRAVGTEVLLAGYDVAHDAGMVQALYGFDNIQEALQHLYSDLDFSDPAYEVTDDQIAAFLNEASNPAAE
nr:Unknown Function [uncultured bacterium]